jgi:hypothetical protein
VSTLQPTDSHVIDRGEIRRAMSASARILARLQQGPALIYELAAITLKFTQRISDLRKAGYVVRCSENAEGYSVYTLESKPQGHDVNSAAPGRMF